MSARDQLLVDSDQVRNLISGVETIRLARTVGASEAEDASSISVARLRIAAYVSLAQELAPFISADFGKALLATDVADGQDAQIPFRNFEAYIDGLSVHATSPTLDDLLYLSASGLLARRPNEVRSRLRTSTLDTFATATPERWSERIRSTTSRALLLITRQQTRNDVAAAGTAIRELSSLQRTYESVWLEKTENSQRASSLLLGHYHVAQSVLRLADYLLSGSVVQGERVIKDFAPELRRLLTRAGEFFEVVGDPDVRIWHAAVSCMVWRLRSDSIWAGVRGTNELLDRMAVALTSDSRERPVFSLLPSQQEALRSNLLDRTQVAVVLEMPTSAGKTLLAEFAIIQAVEAYKVNVRIIYLTPTRALATQIRRTLTEDLAPLGIKISVAGSAFEEDPYELQLLSSADGVIVSTPEKFDLLLRAHPEWLDGLRLVIVDEAHLLKDSERGVRLELLLANLRREQPEARLLLLTPFVDNAEEVAAWLGGPRASSISVAWRPTRTLIGIANFVGRRPQRKLQIEWTEPHRPDTRVAPSQIPFNRTASVEQSALERVAFLVDKFQSSGSVLGMFAQSPAAAEECASMVSASRPALATTTPQLRLAIAIARDDYGENCSLATCLERGVAFHHSSLSSLLRYLIEDQCRAGTIRFVAATTTLAQGMNFPVGTVLVHSVAKPWGGGSLSASEFWNIAGRAGRVGMTDRGSVIFVHERQRSDWQYYVETLTDHLASGLLGVIHRLDPRSDLKIQYREVPELRPFIQFLMHAAASNGARRALAELEELVQTSLANAQADDASVARKLRMVAQTYLSQIASKQPGYLKMVDTTGLGSFSFDELYAKIRADEVLREGPQAVLQAKERGLFPLIDALQWLPEMNLALGRSGGPISIEDVCTVVQGWMDGVRISELAPLFPGSDGATQSRNAGKYVNGTVSQMIAWGAHAYLRGWFMTQGPSASKDPNDRMLGAYIQYGVGSPEASVASLLGVARQLAPALGTVFRESRGNLTPEATSDFRAFVEGANASIWADAISRSRLHDRVDPADVRLVFRQMQGLKD